MRYRPYPYQERATAFIEGHPHCGMLLDMGLGKTVITLTAIDNLIRHGEVSRVLVIAPKTVAEATWSTECGKWDHLRGLRVSRVLGERKRRVAALESEADIYVTSRDLFVWVVNALAPRFPFDMVVIDELTSFKSAKSLRFKAMKVVRKRTSRVVGLTGTPAPNGMLDLWAQVYCLDGGERLGRYVTHYRSRFFDEFIVNHIPIRVTLKPGADEEIMRLISDICLVMQARDYLTLPALSVVDVKVDMPEKARKDYRKFERDMVLELMRGESVTASSAGVLAGKLGQYANGALYLEREGEKSREFAELHSAKLDALREIVEAAQSPVLVFYQFQHDVPRILDILSGWEPRLYEGESTLTDWNAGRIQVLLAHPASTAYGLNMQQGGHYIVWFGLGWSLELYQQANARLYRQGQERPVTVYRLLTAGTIDERAALAMEGKSGTQESLLRALTEIRDEHDKERRREGERRREKKSGKGGER